MKMHWKERIKDTAFSLHIKVKLAIMSKEIHLGYLTYSSEISQMKKSGMNL